MAIEVRGSIYTRNTRIYIAVMLLAVAAWFAFDGWIRQEYQQKELQKGGGKPTLDLQINRWAPIPMGIIGIGCLVLAFRGRNKSLRADEQGLSTSSGLSIPYSSINKIDKRDFEGKGRFTLEYKVGDDIRTVTFSDRQYDNLGMILDEIIRQTGATPV